MKYLLTLLIFPHLLFGYAAHHFFNRFPNAYFVETGSQDGHGIGAGIAAGFKEVHSIELSETHYLRCKALFQDSPKVHLWLGDSGIVLEEVIREMDAPITFWLDGHFCGNTSAKGDVNCPILQELECIKNHPIKTHTILIDDIRLFGSEHFDFIPLSLIEAKIREINPEYTITYEDAHHFSQDVLVARIIPTQD